MVSGASGERGGEGQEMPVVRSQALTRASGEETARMQGKNRNQSTQKTSQAHRDHRRCIIAETRMGRPAEKQRNSLYFGPLYPREKFFDMRP